MSYKITEEQIDLLNDFFMKEFSGSAMIEFENDEIYACRNRKRIFALPLEKPMLVVKNYGQLQMKLTNTIIQWLSENKIKIDESKRHQLHEDFKNRIIHILVNGIEKQDG
jgi:hypothetical protein